MSILLYTLKSVAFALTNPYLVTFLVILAFVLYRRNKKTTIMQKMIIGERINSAFELTISQIVIGIFAGTLASIMMSYLGIVFDETSAVDLIFLLSIVFMFFNQRFICFSYSGSALGIISMLLGFLAVSLQMPRLDLLKIDIVALMSMIAVLHFIEGLLIIADGSTGYIPVFTNRNGKIIGGFALQRYWALPVAMFFILHNASNIGVSSQVAVSTPTWWPIVKNSLPENILKNALLVLMPFYGVIGYNSITFTRSKKEKKFISGGLTIVYSLALFALAQVATLNVFLKILVLIFAPLAHEGILILQRQFELKGTPKYISNEEGIMVLEVAPNSPANEMGISTGDLLVEVNSEKIEDEEKVTKIIKETSNFIWFKVKKVTGKFEEVSYNKMNNSKRLGIVFVPKGVPKDSMVVKFDETRFAEILDKIKNRDKDE
ncbi:PDZ domain-containing protein [Clostridium sp. P21]|uniref:PDZ domain-containing protein n=1 Tax=Clostridium muellerianum TaxID=2716538 RepID=A0A7Y0HNQ5_9CLOT|nr:PDZ domain-containing protein [Clostridium muellerianum]NMM62266.1 PDZ domain-containing protein [Clostridium muellerianum]